MRTSVALLGILVAISFASAEFSLSPYLYAGEKNASVEHLAFSYNNSTIDVIKVGGQEALLTADGRLVPDKEFIGAALTDYYRQNYYLSSSDLSELKGYADAFNKSRNAMTRYGPAEQLCWTSGTFLAHKPCNSLTTCMATASLVCTISGAEGCTIDLLASHILAYSNDVAKLNAAYDKFLAGFNSLGPTTLTASFDKMTSAFDDMKSAADETRTSKLIYPETFSCRDCLGICPEPRFDYSSITAGKAKISALRTKTAPFAALNSAVDRLSLSVAERMVYREGEEKAVIFLPKLKASEVKFAGLKATAVQAKALVADSAFVSAADSFISKQDSLEQKAEKRDFEGFDSLLSSYESAGRALVGMINNSTSAYQDAYEAQDAAGDQLLQALWRVNRLSPSSLSAYNSLADRKNKLDAKFSPPMTSAQYASLASDYGKVESDGRAYVAASATVEDSVFAVGNTFGRASVNGAVSLAGSMAPISFKTRQSVAAYVVPAVLGVLDLSLLSLALLVFAGLFYRFRGFFRSRLAVSGWVLVFLGAVFVLVIGSAGFYGIVLSTEKYTSFTDFYGAIRADSRAAVIVEESGVNSGTSLDAMRKCADQIELQLASIGKKAYKYYINQNSCKSVIPKGGNATNATEVKSGLATACLDSMPDMPVFDLRYSEENQVPVFTTVVTKQAIFKGNAAYYGKKPACDAANVLN